MKSLEIIIGKEDTHICAEGSTKLIALGNEAVQCKSSNATGESLNIIAGRMRNVYFAVSIGNSPDGAAVPSEPGGPTGPYAASALERVTEQVVGNLY
jgi:hypothetical protein